MALPYLGQAVVEERIQMLRAEGDAWRVRQLARPRKDAEDRGAGGGRRNPPAAPLLSRLNSRSSRVGKSSATLSRRDRAIVANGLAKSYAGGIRALDGVSLEVEAGSVFALLGPNGAGKSTAVKILTTLCRPDRGVARVSGLDVLRDAELVRRAIGVVAQRSGADLEATGRENLTLQGQLHGLRGRELARRVSELVERFALGDAIDRLARTYSGGMRRRLDISIGLVHRPSVLFLDEPTTGLDPEVRAKLWDEISRLSGEEGLTILLTTHYLEEAERLARRVAILDWGRVVVEGAPEQLKAELRGDAIYVELAKPSPNSHVQDALDRVVGVRDVVVDGRSLRARADDGAVTIPPLVTALAAVGLQVASASVARPSLDDVYLRYAGRTYEVAERGERS